VRRPVASRHFVAPRRLEIDPDLFDMNNTPCLQQRSARSQNGHVPVLYIDDVRGHSISVMSGSVIRFTPGRKTAR
jgi:hypothetical protein